MKLIQIFSIVSLLQAVSASATQKDDANVEAYPPVHIINSTPSYAVKGRITYLGPGFLCSSDNYNMPPYGDTRHSRGLCLVTDISCNINPDDVPGCDTVRCTPYSSTGTAFSKFSVNRVSQCLFEVSRRVNSKDADEESSQGQGLRGSFLQEDRVLDSSEDADDYMPDEETLEEIEEEELAVIMKAREAIAKIAHDGVAGDMDENTSDEEPPSSLMMMEERRLSSCGTACQACKLACDVKFRVKEEACLLACRVPCLWPGGSVCNKCRAACRAPRETCNRACDLLP